MAKQIFTTAEVDNPYRKGEKETVIINARESNARTLRLGPAQAQAFTRVEKLYHQMGLWRNAAIDPSLEPVDGGGHKEPLTEAQAHAGKEISKLRAKLGRDWLFVDATCLLGLGYGDVARITGLDQRQATFHVKHAYNQLVVEMGLGQATLYERLLNYTHKIRTRRDEKPGIDESQWTTSGENNS